MNLADKIENDRLCKELADIRAELAEVRSAVVQLGGRLPENGAPISRIEGINAGRMRRFQLGDVK